MSCMLHISETWGSGFVREELTNGQRWSRQKEIKLKGVPKFKGDLKIFFLWGPELGGDQVCKGGGLEPLRTPQYSYNMYKDLCL